MRARAARGIARLALALVLLAAPAAAREATWPVPGDGALTHEATVTWGRLGNGLRYAIMPNATPPGRVSLRLLIEAGSLMEDEDQRGLAHFVEHMAFKGSANLAPGELIETLQRMGLAFGADTNASTGFDATIYKLDLPRNDAGLVATGFDILSEILGRLRLAAERIEPERGVILSEKRQRDTPGARSFEAMLGFLLPGSRVAERQPIGLESVIRTAPRQRLVDFYEAYYTPERGVVVVVGDVPPGEIAAMIAARFGGLAQPPAAPADPAPPPLAARGLDAMLLADPGLPAAVSLSRVLPLDLRPEGLARRRDRLIEILLGSMLGRRLQHIGLRSGAPFQRAWFGVSEIASTVRIARLRLSTSPERWRDALAAGEQELRRALAHGFSEAELADAVADFRGRLEARAAGAPTRDTVDLARELVAAIAEGRIFSSPATDLEVSDRLTRGLRASDIEATLRDLWGSEEPQIIVSGPIELAAPRADILAAYAASRAVAVTAVAAPVAEAFPYGDWGPPGAILERTAIDDLGIVRATFANGVQLDLKATDFEADTIHVAVRFGTGRLGMPTDRPGLDLLAARGFVEGGVARLSLEGLARLRAAHRVGVELVVSDSSLILLGRTTPADLPLQLDLVAAYVTDAAYRPVAEERHRQRLEARYARLATEPRGALSGPVARLLNGGDPRFAMPPEAEATARSMAELRQWLEPMLRRGPMQVIAVGDIDPARLIAEVGRTLGALPPRGAAGPPPEAPAIRQPAASEPVRLGHGGRPDRALATVYWPTTSRDDPGVAIGLALVADILEDRLRREVREREGATYSPSSFSHQSLALPGYGHIAAALDVAAAEAQRMGRLIRDTAAAMHAGGITEDELARALQPRLAQARTSLASNDYWFRGVLIGMEQYPQRVDEARHLLAHHERQSLASVQALASRHLDPARALPILIVPADGAASLPDGAAAVEAD
jgi:zinc protease